MINELVNSIGFFQGRFPTHALIDTVSYKIYLVDTRPDALHLVKKIFSSKRNLTVVELPPQYNGTELVDNSVSIWWQVKAVPGIRFFSDSAFFFPEESDEVPERAVLLLMHEKKQTSTVVNQDQFVLEQTHFTDLDIDLVKQMFMLVEISKCGDDSHKIKISKDEMALIRRSFDISLTLNDLEKNLATLASDMYASNNMLIGKIIYNSLPQYYRYI